MLDIINYLLDYLDLKASIYSNLIIDDKKQIIGSFWQEENITYLELFTFLPLKITITTNTKYTSYIPGAIDSQITYYQINFNSAIENFNLIIKNTILYTIFIDDKQYKLAIFKNETVPSNNNFSNLAKENLTTLQRKLHFN